MDRTEERTDLVGLESDLEAARDAWNEWQDAWDKVLEGLRRSSDVGLHHEWARLDAYKVGVGYDEGMGYSMEHFLDEVYEALMEADGGVGGLDGHDD